MAMGHGNLSLATIPRSFVGVKTYVLLTMKVDSPQRTCKSLYSRHTTDLDNTENVFVTNVKGRKERRMKDVVVLVKRIQRGCGL